MKVDRVVLRNKIQTITDQILELVPKEGDRQMLLHNIHWFRESEETHAHFMNILRFSMMDGSIPESLERAMQTFRIEHRLSFVEGFQTRVDQVLRQLAVETAAVDDPVSDLSGSGSVGGFVADDDTTGTNGAISRPRKDNSRLSVLAAGNNQDGDTPAPIHRSPGTRDMEGSGIGDETMS